MTTEPPHLFELLVTLATALGAKSIADLPGCWEHAWTHDKLAWFIAMHAHAGKKRTTTTGAEIDAFSFWIECNGWPAGIVDPAGWSVAAGSVINEDALRRAIVALVEEVSGDLRDRDSAEVSGEPAQ